MDAIAEFSDGTFENIANVATWKSQDENIVSVYEGQVIGEAKGTTTLTVSYNGVTEKITVTVENTINVEDRINEVLKLTREKESMDYKTNAASISSATSIAQGMVSTTWTPTQALTRWVGEPFPAGKTVTGMPYSQTPYQKNTSDFLASMSNLDFYTTYYSGSKSMPRYGNDCSGFVSIAWGISRNTTQTFLKGIKLGTYTTVGTAYYTLVLDSDGSYRIYNYDDVLMKTSLGYMTAGDALIKYQHVFMVAANYFSSELVYVYEQTPSTARYTSYTYDDLTSIGYIPFRK